MTVQRRAGSVEDLAQSAFAAVEYDQGKGFVSDALGALGSRKKIFKVLRIHLRHSEIAAKKLREFLRLHGELP